MIKCVVVSDEVSIPLSLGICLSPLSLKSEAILENSHVLRLSRAKDLPELLKRHLRSRLRKIRRKKQCRSLSSHVEILRKPGV